MGAGRTPSILPGSEGTFDSTDRLSVQITPTGIPPSFPRPIITDLAHDSRYSVQESASNRPVFPFAPVKIALGLA